MIPRKMFVVKQWVLQERENLVKGWEFRATPWILVEALRYSQGLLLTKFNIYGNDKVLNSE